MDTQSRYESFLVQYYAGVARDLPLISPFARALARTARNEPPRRKALVEAYLTDPFLAAKVIGVSNSIFYARDPEGVLTVVEALRRVGARYAQNLLWKAPPLPVGVDEDHIALLWAHCMAVARTARAVAAHATDPPLSPDSTYLVAMIHDIGYLLQLQYSRHSSLSVAAQLEHGETEDTVVHPVQGEELAKFWFLPAVATAAIRHHHEPLQCTEGSARWLSQVIALSESLIADEDEAQWSRRRHQVFQRQLGISEAMAGQLAVEGSRTYRECLQRADRLRLGARRPVVSARAATVDSSCAQR